MFIVGVSVRLRGFCKVLKELIRGRTQVALARQDRVTTKAVLRYLPDDAFWIDRSETDGARVRIIVKRDTGGVVLPSALGQGAVGRQLEQGPR